MLYLVTLTQASQMVRVSQTFLILMTSIVSSNIGQHSCRMSFDLGLSDDFLSYGVGGRLQR